jgi:hypothetical protein
MKCLFSRVLTQPVARQVVTSVSLVVVVVGLTCQICHMKWWT